MLSGQKKPALNNSQLNGANKCTPFAHLISIESRRRWIKEPAEKIMNVLLVSINKYAKAALKIMEKNSEASITQYKRRSYILTWGINADTNLWIIQGKSGITA